MAYVDSALQKITNGIGGQANNFFIYSTSDAIATVNTANYFLGGVSRLAAGDAILVIGNGIPTLTYVATRTDSAVDVVDGTTVATTDSD
jgi:hypothetical protein